MPNPLLSVVFCAVISGTLWSIAKTSSERSNEDTIMSLKQTMDEILNELRELKLKQEKYSTRLSAVEIVLVREVSEIRKLVVKENLTRTLVTSYIDSRSGVEEVFRTNMTSSLENLRLHLNESLLEFRSRQSNFTVKMSNLENSLSRFERVCANVSYVSKLDESLQDLAKTAKAGLKSVRNEVYSRLEQLEKRGVLRDDVQEIQTTLGNLTSEISAMDTQLFDIKNSCSDLPAIENGRPVIGDRSLWSRRHGIVVNYACDAGRTFEGRGDLVCRFGEWTGVPPYCAKDCDTQSLKDYEGLIIPVGTTIEHSKTLDILCDRGYTISSSGASITCNDGTWHISTDPCIGDTD